MGSGNISPAQRRTDSDSYNKASPREGGGVGGGHHLPAHVLYLVAVMDWHSRYVLAWRLSNTMGAGFCAEGLEEVLTRGQPELFNTDQGSQFTPVLQDRGVRISMDGRGGTRTTSSWSGCGGL